LRADEEVFLFCDGVDGNELGECGEVVEDSEQATRLRARVLERPNGDIAFTSGRSQADHPFVPPNT
jgi:hypothetical protein